MTDADTIRIVEFSIAVLVLLCGIAVTYGLLRGQVKQNTDEISDLKDAMNERIGGLRESVNRKIDRIDTKLDRHEEASSTFRENIIDRISHLEAKNNGKDK